MRYMSMLRMSEGLFARNPPPPAFMEAMGRFVQEGLQSPQLVDTGGLVGSAQGVRVRAADGRLKVIDGPFTEAKEVVGGYAVYDVKSKEEALRWTERFMQLHIDHWPGWEGETELRQIFNATAAQASGREG